jgi:hypothetical protein
MPELERHEELIGVIDVRRGDLEDDGEETEQTEEIDDTVGDAPGTSVLLAHAAAQADETSAVRDYLIEYTQVHLSPVIARALRMYRERGLSAMSEELKITKAPRKTLNAIVELSQVRYRKVALIYDELQSWKEIPLDLRSQVVGSIANIRWKLADSAVMVFMAAPGEAPELEETFGGGERIVWDFHNLQSIQAAPAAVNGAIVNEWLASAALPGSEPLAMDHPVLSRMAEEAHGALPRFLDLAREAIEDAADRGVELDDAAYESAVARLAAAEADSAE